MEKPELLGPLGSKPFAAQTWLWRCGAGGGATPCSEWPIRRSRWPRQGRQEGPAAVISLLMRRSSHALLSSCAPAAAPLRDRLLPCNPALAAWLPRLFTPGIGPALSALYSGSPALHQGMQRHCWALWVADPRTARSYPGPYWPCLWPSPVIGCLSLFHIGRKLKQYEAALSPYAHPKRTISTQAVSFLIAASEGPSTKKPLALKNPKGHWSNDGLLWPFTESIGWLLQVPCKHILSQLNTRTLYLCRSTAGWVVNFVVRHYEGDTKRKAL